WFLKPRKFSTSRWRSPHPGNHDLLAMAELLLLISAAPSNACSLAGCRVPFSTSPTPSVRSRPHCHCAPNEVGLPALNWGASSLGLRARARKVARFSHRAGAPLWRGDDRGVVAQRQADYGIWALDDSRLTIGLPNIAHASFTCMDGSFPSA